MYDRLLSFIYRIENNTVLSVIRNGFILIIPAVITGSIALLIQNFPILPLQDWLQAFCGGILHSILGFIFDSTVGFMSAFLVLAISYYYSITFAPRNISLQIISMLTSLACFVASFGGESGSLTLASFGPVGVFTAMVCAILATRLFFALFNFLAKHNTNYSLGADLQYHNSMVAIFPVLVCVTLFAAANWILSSMFGVSNFNDLISNGLVEMFKHIHSELANGLLFTLMLHVLWFFGIHGGNALDPVAQILFVPADTNPTAIISKSFIDNFVAIGGCGTTICLVLALLIVSRSISNRKLSSSAAPLTLFNINEIIVFGLPIVLNPVMLIPFIAVPICSMLIAYGSTLIGFMPIVNNTVTWTTPAFFSGYLATGSIRGAIVQAAIIAIGTAIYIPFVRFAEKLQDRREVFLLEEITERFKKNEKAGITKPYLSRQDNMGRIAKSIIAKLKADIANDKIDLYYQPQVDHTGGVTGAEALLRWKFSGSFVYPPLIIALAREDGCLNALTVSILTKAFGDIRQLCSAVNPNFQVSVNIIAEQLDNPVFIKQLIAAINREQNHDNILIEVTEELSLNSFANISEHIELLRKNGIFMAIDDFGMGQTSLDYLRNNLFQYVKLDGSLVCQVTENPRCQQIIRSIVALGKDLQFQVVAEYVETEEIRDMLLSLGCDYFQGYLYSPAVPLEELIAYCKKQ